MKLPSYHTTLVVFLYMIAYGSNIFVRAHEHIVELTDSNFDVNIDVSVINPLFICQAEIV